MSRHYVNISHLTDDQLELYGWYLDRENEQFKVYTRPYGQDAQIVEKARPFLLVEDPNDAVYMKATEVLEAPSE